MALSSSDKNNNAAIFHSSKCAQHKASFCSCCQYYIEQCNKLIVEKKDLQFSIINTEMEIAELEEQLNALAISASSDEDAQSPMFVGMFGELVNSPVQNTGPESVDELDDIMEIIASEAVKTPSPQGQEEEAMEVDKSRNGQGERGEKRKERHSTEEVLPPTPSTSQGLAVQPGTAEASGNAPEAVAVKRQKTSGTFLDLDDAPCDEAALLNQVPVSELAFVCADEDVNCESQSIWHCWW